MQFNQWDILQSMGGSHTKTVYTTEQEKFWAKVEKTKHTLHTDKTFTASVTVFVIIKPNGLKSPELKKGLKL